jgi:hypothetical protein
MSMFKSLPNVPWYFVTRGMGAFLVMYGLLVDDSAERGSIILGGLGLLGIDKVARSEPEEKAKAAKKSAEAGKE